MGVGTDCVRGVGTIQIRKKGMPDALAGSKTLRQCGIISGDQLEVLIASPPPSPEKAVEVVVAQIRKQRSLKTPSNDYQRRRGKPRMTSLMMRGERQLKMMRGGGLRTLGRRSGRQQKRRQQQSERPLRMMRGR